MPGIVYEVDFAAQIARLVKGTEQGATSVKKMADQIESASSFAKSALGALGVSISATSFAHMITGAIEAQAHMGDLARVAGTTAQVISSFEEPARTSGTALDTVATSIARLGRSIGEARLGDESKKGILAALGVNANDGRSAAEHFVDISRVLITMKDQEIAAKISNELLGKSFAELRPFMAEVVEQGKLTATVTNEQAARAKELSDEYQRIRLQLDLTKRALAEDMLPTLKKITDAFAEGVKQGGLFEGVIKGIQVALTGTDLDKANKEFSQLGLQYATLNRQIAELENGLSRQTVGGRLTARKIEQLKAERAEIEHQIVTVGNYIQMLKGEQRAQEDAAKSKATAEGAQNSSKASAAEAAVRARFEFEKNYTALLAAAKAKGDLFAQTIKTSDALADEAFKQGEISQVTLLRQKAANQDAALGAQISSLQAQLALAKQKGDREREQTIANAIGQAEAERQAAAIINQAKIESANIGVDDNELDRRRKILDQVQQLEEQHLTEMEVLGQQLADKQTLLDLARSNDLISEDEYQRQRYELTVRYSAARTLVEQRESQSLRAMQMQNVSLGIGLLQQFAGHSRAAAIAAIALQKAQAAATVIIMTEAAVAQAWARGPEVGAVLEAKLRTQEAISLGLIAATGLVEAANVGGGGAAVGTPGNPQVVAPVQSPAAQLAGQASQQGQTTVIEFAAKAGDRFDEADVRELLRKISDATRAGGRVVIAGEAP